MEQSLAVVDPKKRTMVQFPVSGDPWPMIADWAKRNGYNPRAPQTGNVKLFQKGSGLWTAPMRAQFTHRGDTMELQAWVFVPLLARFFALFLLPEEIHINSGGFKAVLPRSMARKAVNELLHQNGAPPIA